MEKGHQLWLFFFFQAEDGIRDGHVTGVQTCALPIYARGRIARRRAHALHGPAQSDERVEHMQAGAREPAAGRFFLERAPAAGDLVRVLVRSEERRVGKECRGRCWGGCYNGKGSSVVAFFFFSSRRRHTRWPRDWSSDVCSSDLRSRKNRPAAGSRAARARTIR